MRRNQHENRVLRRDLPNLALEVVQIIGGQIVSTVGCIQYSASDPALSALYNPDVDTTYPVGMGNAWLMDSQGNQVNRVLVRHDFAGATGPLIGGWVYVVRTTVTLTVGSGPDAGSQMTAYAVTWQL